MLLEIEVPESLPTHLPETPLWIGQTPAMRHVAREILLVASADTTSVLILGESGSGKDMVAGAIHAQSRRARRPFVAVNCATIQSNLAESKLFGSEPGSFTGAVLHHGFIEQAHSGTLFLDEIGELDRAAQPALLRFLQTRRYRRMGAERERGADVRVIAATLRDLSFEIDAGVFRPDLFYRLNVFPIYLPPLRDRGADLPAIVAAMLAELSREASAAGGSPCVAPPMLPQTMEMLRAYPWPGNVRELRNELEHARIVCQGQPLAPEHFSPRVQRIVVSPQPEVATFQATLDTLRLPSEGLDMPEMISWLEARMIGDALERCGHNQSRAATLLGYTRDQMRQRMKRLGITGDSATA
jgi:two-component system, NtrC family, response regulator AtoC